MTNRILLIVGGFFLFALSIKVFSTPHLQTTPAPKSVTSSKKVDITTRHELKQISAKTKKLNPKVLKLALHAYHRAEQKHLVHNPYLTVIDYSKPSTAKRLWVINMKNRSVAYNTRVAHGKNSGLTKSTHFSNRNGSKESSLGVYLTRNPFVGGHVGYALQIQGLEKGINDKALRRGVVVHGAKYVDNSFIKRVGRAGRSWGCPAIPTKFTKPLINTIKNGSILFVYYPDRAWLAHSKFLA